MGDIAEADEAQYAHESFDDEIRRVGIRWLGAEGFVCLICRVHWARDERHAEACPARRIHNG